MNIVRKNGDRGIDYYVNDDTLDLKEISKDKRVILIGERHGNAKDEKLMLDLIKVFKPDYILAEALADYKLHTTEDKKTHLSKDVEEHYYYEYTQHWVELSLKTNIPFIGIEYVKWDEKTYEGLSRVESFATREKHFLNMIKTYSRLGKVIVVVGDTHLRTIKTKELGPVSPLYETFSKDPKAIIIRSEKGEIT